MAIKIEMLRSFSAVAEAGNLQDAADRLGRTQSALSMTLKQLEEHLGQRLFENERKNKLTPLGRQIFDLAKKQLREFDFTLRAIESSANSPDGLVQIASIPTVARLVFPGVIETVTDQYPGLKIDLRDMDSQGVIDALARGHVDLGVASGQYSLNGIKQTPLFSDSFGLICSSTHRLAQKKGQLEVQDLMPDEFIHNNLSNQISDPEFKEMAENTRLSVHNTLSLLAMVETGKWITVLPKSVIQMTPVDLTFRPIKELREKREVCLYQREHLAFKMFVDALADHVMAFVKTNFADSN